MLSNGLDYISSISIGNITNRIKELCGLFLQKIQSLVHSNGLPLIKLPFYYIEQLANAERISIRTGCFCNPGIDEMNNDISADQLREYFSSRTNGDFNEFMQFLSRSRGAVRISFGLPTTTGDIRRFILFAEKLLNKRVPAAVALACGE